MALSGLFQRAVQPKLNGKPMTSGSDESVAGHKNIDFSDISETTDDFWKDARISQPNPQRQITTSLTNKDFSDESYAALGRVMRTFGILEHEIMRAAIGLTGDTEVIESDHDKKSAIENAIGGAFAKRLKAFCEAYETSGGDPEWLTNFKEKMREGISARDHFVHGQWSEELGGKLKCVFFKRGKKNKPPEEMVWFGSRQALAEIAETNMRNAKILSDHFHTPTNQAAE